MLEIWFEFDDHTEVTDKITNCAGKPSGKMESGLNTEVSVGGDDAEAAVVPGGMMADGVLADGGESRSVNKPNDIKT